MDIDSNDRCITFLAACVRENTPEIQPDNNADTTIAIPQNNGNFMNRLYGSLSGMATVYRKNDSLVLALTNMSISNGPDFHVYIQKEVQSQYKYVLIYSKRFSHLFAVQS
jgi:hypothetical protein